VLGKPVELTLWDEGYAANQPKISTKKGLTVSICGANFYEKPAKRPPLQIKKAQDMPPVTPATATNIVAPAINPTAENINQNHTSDNLQEALRITQQSMQALQALQEQTSKLHQQFLVGQQQATNSFMQLVTQQQQLVQGVAVVPNLVASPVVAPVTIPEMPPAKVQETQVTTSAQVAIETPQITSDNIDIAPQLLEIIAEKTGYPVEMLELDMALDTDWTQIWESIQSNESKFFQHYKKKFLMLQLSVLKILEHYKLWDK